MDNVYTLDVGRIDVNVVRHQLWFRKAVSRLPMDASFRQPVLEILQSHRHVLLLLFYVYFDYILVIECNYMEYFYEIIFFCLCMYLRFCSLCSVHVCVRVCVCYSTGEERQILRLRVSEEASQADCSIYYRSHNFG